MRIKIAKCDDYRDGGGRAPKVGALGDVWNNCRGAKRSEYREY